MCVIWNTATDSLAWLLLLRLLNTVPIGCKWHHQCRTTGVQSGMFCIDFAQRLKPSFIKPPLFKSPTERVDYNNIIKHKVHQWFSPCKLIILSVQPQAEKHVRRFSYFVSQADADCETSSLTLAIKGSEQDEGKKLEADGSVFLQRLPETCIIFYASTCL